MADIREGDIPSAVVTPVRVEDLDVEGGLFGLIFEDGPHGRLVHLYLEDDERWHLKMTFHEFWLRDLQGVATKGANKAGMPKVLCG